MAKTIKDLPIGSKVKDLDSKYINSVMTWVIADKNHSGYPSNSITLVSEKAICKKAIDAKEFNNPNNNRQKYGNNRYSVSNQRQWLNSDKENWYSPQHSYDEPPNKDNGTIAPYDTEKGFMCNLSDKFKNNLLNTNLKVVKASVDGGDSETFTDKIFLLSVTEVGLGNENNISEGSRLTLFTDDKSRKANCRYFLRTPDYSDENYVRTIIDEGDVILNKTIASNFEGIRPALNLKSDVIVSTFPDSDGCYLLFITNIPPSISGNDGNYGNKKESFVIPYSVNDIDSSDTLTIKEKLDNTLINTINNAVKNQEYKIDLNSKFNDLSLGKHTIQIEVSDGQATVIRTYTFTKVNEAPKISEADEDLGILFKPSFVKEYIISDSEKDLLKIDIKIDDNIVKTLENQKDGAVIKLDLNDYWINLSLGEHIVKIEVSDKYHTVIRTVRFVKSDDKIIFNTKPIETSREVRKISLTSILSKEESDILTVYCSNNAFDKVPTWEDCTEEYINKLPYFFKNKEKTSDKWGLSIKFDLRKQGEKVAKN